MISRLLLLSFWFLVWLGLVYPADTHYVILGLAAAIFVYLMTYDMFEFKRKAFLNPKRWLYFILYAAVFVWECVKANLDVAWRVLHPDIPIRPGTIKVKTELKSDIALTFLAGSITLTPGTTAIDIDKEKGILYIHWLRVKDGYDPSSMTIPVARKFEYFLSKIFE